MKTFLLSFFLLTASLQAIEDNRKPVSKKDRELILKVMKANEGLHGALFKYDKDKLRKEAKLYQDQIAEPSSVEIKKILKGTLPFAQELTTDQTKSKDNESYHKLSLALVKLIETYNIGSTYNVFYCPMVKKRWVQNSKEMRKVHNPYAPEMPHCGGQLTEY